MSAKTRLLVWLVLIAAASVSAPAAALSLGAPQVHSVLGEPINATLPIEGSRAGGSYTVRVASEEEFRRLGLSVPSWVRNLTVSTEQSSDGRTYVRLGSRAPMREPLAYVVLELMWDGGRMLREVTLLFDPPTLRRSAPLPTPPSPRAATSPGPSTRPASAQRAGAATTRANDTLWGLAERLRPAGVSQQQMMDTLLRANPQAFVDGDPNRLRIGVTLQVPSLTDVRNKATSVAAQPSAQPAVKAENPAPQTASDENAATAAASSALRVVSPEDTGTGEPLDELHAQIHIARAEITTRRAQNQAMLDRVAQLEERSAALLRELERKQQAAAALRAKLNEPTTAGEASAASQPTESALVETETPVPPPAPRVDAWRGWTLAAAALILGAVTSVVLLVINSRRSRARQPLQSPQDEAGERPERSKGGGSNYSPSVFAETSAALAGVLADDETKADPMVEVAFLKNFGRWEQAETLLRDLITQYPKRDDYRFELLELYYRAQNIEAFKAFAGALQPSLLRRAPGLWSEIARMGQRLDSSDPLFRDGVGTDQTGASVGDDHPRSASG